MQTLNLVGLILGYLGSISLAAGLMKSKQEVVDEERPFWGPNPFRIRSTLRSRMLGFFGLGLLVTGFATTTVAMAFDTVFDIDNIPLALVLIALLVVAAFILLYTTLQAKRVAHQNARHRYYFRELINTVRELSKEEIPAGVSDHNHDFETLQKHYIGQISTYSSDLDTEGRSTLGRLMNALRDASGYGEIKAILDEFLIEQESTATQKTK